MGQSIKRPVSTKTITYSCLAIINVILLIAINLYVNSSNKQVLKAFRERQYLSYEATLKEKLTTTGSHAVSPEWNSSKSKDDEWADRLLLENATQTALFVFALLLVGSGFMVFILSKLIFQPIHTLRESTANKAGGSWKKTNPSTYGLEFSELAEEINQIIEEIEKAELELVSSYDELDKEKNKQLRQAYAAGMAENAVAVLHNIGNAITPVAINLKYLAKRGEISTIGLYLEKFLQTLKLNLQDENLDHYFKEDEKGKQMIPFLSQMVEQIKKQVEEDRKSISKMEAQIKHIGEIITIQQKYADFKGQDELFQMESVLLDAIQMIQPAVEKRGIMLDMDLESELLPIRADKNKLVQVLLNIFKNTIESIDEEVNRNPGKKPEIKIAASLVEEKQVRLSIVDNGIGIEKNDLPNIFKFGFTTKNRNSGFGLHDCANFVRANKGTIRITSTGIGEGAQVVITLPVDYQDSAST